MKTFRTMLLGSVAVVSVFFAGHATPASAYFKADGATCKDTNETAAAPAAVPVAGAPVVSGPHDQFGSQLNGVLVDCTQPNLLYYLDALLNENLTYIMFVAFIMIIASGVQYMLSGFAPDGAKKAKERIVGILIGVIFFLSIRLILNQISGGISLPDSAAPVKEAPANPVVPVNPPPAANPPAAGGGAPGSQ
jgi:glycerol uptake facilitator-like aquaporin